MFVSDRGQRMLDEAKLVREDEGRLHAVAADADSALAESLSAINAGGGLVGKEGLAIALSNAADGRWKADVLPLVDGARRSVGKAHAAIAAVFVRSSSLASKAPIETMATRYGLTASEIKVVEAMLSTSGLDAIASALGISRATVKTHLNHVYHKSGARNQSELIKLIVSL